MADDLKQRLRYHKRVRGEPGYGDQMCIREDGTWLQRKDAKLLVARIEALEAENATLKADKAAEVAHADRLADFIEPMTDMNPSETCGCRGCQAAFLISDHEARRKG